MASRRKTIVPVRNRSRIVSASDSSDSDDERAPAPSPRNSAGNRTPSTSAHGERAAPPNGARPHAARTNQEQQPTNRARRKAQPLRRQRVDRVMQEIRIFQRTTGLIIPNLPFHRLFKDTLLDMGHEGFRAARQSIFALKEAAEMYLVQLFEDSYLCTIHRGRVTLTVKDVELAKRLRGPNDPGNH